MKNNKIVGITFGSFDLCHYGHILMFKECKEHCDYLIVGVQSDPSLDRSEKNKPIQSHEERAGVVESLRYVDEIRLYDRESDVVDLLKEIKPDVRILGADHEGTKFTGHDLPIKCVFNSRDHGFSTSELRKRIYSAEKEKI
ncbi:MAG TPA: glycerol-3-phosphate cytidylyltransferase [Candidatus Marinimicrobia bacterium]|nr:glycerol-3-phosphate cytidylyltransferase [Candidatus Neomarinimicrobiota bacterium]